MIQGQSQEYRMDGPYVLSYKLFLEICLTFTGTYDDDDDDDDDIHIHH